jgi:phosphoribosylformylglycinamidine cyclo-ligase
VSSARLDLESYRASGVDVRTVDAALKNLVEELRPTLGFRPITRTDIGHFAAIVDLGPTWIAVSTDGVGTKSLIAQWMGRYDTIGIDCVACNVNDVLCVGAEPITMVDYLGVHGVDETAIGDVGKGLREGARRARITISGGETAVLPDVIQQRGPGMGFDLVGTGVGQLSPEAAVTGERIEPGDPIIGLASSGVHCNGLSLARRAFEIDPDHLGSLDERPTGLEGTVGEELLRPSNIYVEPVMAMRAAGIELRGLAHITGGGFLKLPRLGADVGYAIDRLPAPQPVFGLIQDLARVRDEEMYEVFNMGVGFCAIVAPQAESRALEVVAQHGLEAIRIGHATDDPSRTVRLDPVGLEGNMGEGFHKV